MFLQEAAGFLSSVVDDIYYEAIETILWSYATFSFHPGCDLLGKLTSKIDGQLRYFSALHLANILWCYVLFDSCTLSIWQTILEAFSAFPVAEVSPEALYRLFQAYLLKTRCTEDPFELPRDLQEAGMQLWKHQTEHQKTIASPFHADVLRILSSFHLHSQIFQHYCCANQTLCVSFYIESLQRGIELIDEHEFTMNTTEPIGSAIMRTKVTQTLIPDALGSSSTVEFLKFTFWQSLQTDGEKQEHLRRILTI